MSQFHAAWMSYKEKRAHRVRSLQFPHLQLFQVQHLQLHPPAMFQLLAPPQPISPSRPVLQSQAIHQHLKLSPPIKWPVIADLGTSLKGVTPIPMPAERRQVRRMNKI